VSSVHRSRLRTRLTVCVAASCVLSTGAFFPSRADATVAQTAIAQCNGVELVAEADRPDAIGRALALAEAALKDAPEEASSHYAMFCVLAKRVRHSGTSLRALGDLRRMRIHIDRALAIDPAYAEAHAAKGAYLYYLPRIMGGDTTAGLELLARSIALDPDNPATRLLYADVLADLGDHKASLRESLEAARLLAGDRNQRHRAAACSVVDICADGRWSNAARLVVSGAC